MKKFSRIMALLLSAMLILCSCGGKKEAVKREIGEAKFGNEYPLETDESLTWWLQASLNPEYKTYDEQPIYRAYQEATGVDIEFILPAQGQMSDAFRLMIASGDLPDIITHNWATNDGGPQSYITNGTIIPLKDVINAYAPNLRAYLDSRPGLDKLIKMENGEYYAFPTFMGEGSIHTAGGPIVRKDLFEKHNIAYPETIDEWYVALKKLKENGVRYPLTTVNGTYPLASGFDAYDGWYQENGEVKYGPMQPEWLDYINTMQKWFKEGLVDADLGSIDQAVMDQKVLSGDSAVFQALGSTFNRISNAGKKANPDFELTGVKYPSPEKGKKSKFGAYSMIYSGYGSAAITTACKNVELAARVIDYSYSKEGQMLTNFGIEGVSYEMIDGYPTYTDKVRDPVTGSVIGADKYTMYPSGQPAQNMIQDPRSYEQRAGSPEFLASVPIWAENDMEKHYIPRLIFNAEDSAATKGILVQVNDLMKEFFYNGIFAKSPVTQKQFDEYVQSLKNLGIEKYIEIETRLLKNMDK